MCLSDIPIIGVSAQNDSAIIGLAMAAGMDDYGMLII